MTIRVTEDCRVAYQCGAHVLTAGQEIPDSEFADYLVATGAPVEPLEPSSSADAEQDAGQVGIPRPAANAAKADWVAHVADLHGLDADEVAQLTKTQLVEMADTPPEAADASPAGIPE